MAARWYVAQLQAGMRLTAEANLQRQRFEFDSMLVRGERGPAQLFPGYIFVRFDRFDPDCRWRSVNGTTGIEKLLPLHLENPMPIMAGLVEDFTSQIAAGSFDHKNFSATVAKHAVGEKVAVISGAWAGHSGTLRRQRKGCLFLLMSLLGRELEIPVPAHQVGGS